ncbi:hypothetical protein ACPZ13_36565 (plasmid) [Streptomyces sp. IPPR8]|uniref:hypothetical protein n=1 Tax=Streptomyces sp. IPPR8 TaxID=3417301 RepID=UPI003D69CAA6
MKVLGEGVDTRNCDSVYFADVRGSMPDLVQAVGRALRMRPGEGKVASLVVPVLLGPGETVDNMLHVAGFSVGSRSCWRRCGRMMPGWWSSSPSLRRPAG